jgi:putative transposase
MQWLFDGPRAALSSVLLLKRSRMAGSIQGFSHEQHDHLNTVLRYIERNPLRAGLVEQAEGWRWSSLQHWQANGPVTAIDPGPVRRPENWLRWVNEPLGTAELQEVRQSVNRETPYGSPTWATRMATELGLRASLRPRGSPRKEIEM